MSFWKILTQKELKEAMDEVVAEMENDKQQDIDVVYIPPDVDTLTDEENIDDESNIREIREPNDIVGTFELQIPELLKCDDSSSTKLPEWDSSDEETLVLKRKRIISGNASLPGATKWKKCSIEYTHAPTSDEFRSCEELKNKLSGKTPLELFVQFFDDEVIELIVNFS